MVSKQLSKIRLSYFDRLPFIFSTILVFVIYQSSKTPEKSVPVISKDADLSKISSHAPHAVENFSETPPIRYNPQFNPFVQSSTYVDDIMMAYSYNNFGVNPKNRTIKYILFWNNAYGSKDYGK